MAAERIEDSVHGSAGCACTGEFVAICALLAMCGILALALVLMGAALCSASRQAPAVPSAPSQVAAAAESPAGAGQERPAGKARAGRARRASPSRSGSDGGEQEQATIGAPRHWQTVAEMKEALRARGLPVGGLKADLAARLAAMPESGLGRRRPGTPRMFS